MSLQLVFILPQMTMIPFYTKFRELYQEYRELNKIHIPSFETHIRVLYRIWADSKQRRIERARMLVISSNTV